MNSNWIVIDGSPTSTPCGYVHGIDVACNGLIEATNSGTGMGNAESIGVNARGASNIEVRNLAINNMYVHTNMSSDVPPGNYYAIWFSGNNNNFHNLILKDTPAGVVGETPNSGNNIYNSQMFNINWGVFLSGGSSANGIANDTIHDNDIHDFSNFDTPSDSFHHDGIMVAGNNNSANGINGVDIYNNYIHGSASSPTCSGGNPCVTAFIFVNDANHVRTFNNVLIAKAGEYAGNGWIFYWSPGSLNSGDAILNNTVIGGTQSDGGCIYVEGDASMTLENNITSNCAYLLWTVSNTTFTALNNNVYQSSSLQWRNNSSVLNSLASWQSASGGDSNAKTMSSALSLSATFAPSAGSPAIGAGANLSSLGVGALDTDIAGNVRPSSGTWDAGVYQTGSTSVQRPLPPTALVATVK
jgi:hypothetical protein